MTTHDEDGEWVEVGTTDGTVLGRVPVDLSNIEAGIERMREAFGRMAEALEALPMPHVTYDYWHPDPRRGDEVYVYDLLPGARVYVLEDVFTVDRVDLDATPPTVLLKELPTSPLYFSEDHYIYLANETED